MDWFLYDNDLRHERVNIRSEIWKRTLDKNEFYFLRKWEYSETCL